MADMPAIMAIARKHGLLVIEDAGALHGARLDGISAGLWGDVGTFSFSPSTVMGGCGEAGMIVTNNEKLAAECRLIRNHGQQEGIRFIHKRIGLNSRMDEIQAMFLDQKLDDSTTSWRSAPGLPTYIATGWPLSQRGLFCRRPPSTAEATTRLLCKLRTATSCVCICRQKESTLTSTAQPSFRARPVSPPVRNQ